MGLRYQIFHDLSNVIGMLKGHIESLLAECDAKDNFQKNPSRTAAIRMSFGRIDDLIHQYRDAADDVPGQALQAVFLDTWANQLQEIILPSLGALHQLEIQFEQKIEDEACIVIKPAHFHAICDNLIANASSAGAKRVQVELVDARQSIDLVVRDNGCGMTAEQLRQLGLGFSTKSEAGHGRGFRIICQLASESGAMVREPQSIPGVGTEVIVSFMKVAAGTHKLFP